MYGTRLGTAGVILWLAGALPAAAASPPPGPYTAEPPHDINALLARVRDRDRPSAAVAALAARDDAAPYLRQEVAAAKDRLVRRDLGEALEAIEGRVYDRNLVRARAWVAARRLDLYAEFLSGCRDQDAVDLADRMWPLKADILDEAGKVVGPPRFPPFGGFRQRFGQFVHLAGDPLTVPEKPVRPALIRAGDCTLDIWEKDHWLLAVRGELKDPPKQAGGIGMWWSSVALVNGPMPLGTCQHTLVVCDGDVDVYASVDHSVVIANGDIRRALPGKVPGADGGTPKNSALCAMGDIEPGLSAPETNLFHAGGVVRLGGKVAPGDRVRERQPGLPFGVRFLDPREFGLDLAAQNGGVQVMGLSADSPFARYDVRDADVITHADDADIKTVPAFRRALRRGVLRESVVLRLRRDGKPITRIVFLDGVPEPPAAPAPRPANP